MVVLGIAIGSSLAHAEGVAHTAERSRGIGSNY
jgi:hypothetical protein